MNESDPLSYQVAINIEKLREPQPKLNETYLESFDVLVKNICKEQNIKLQELAKYIGISPETLSRYLNDSLEIPKSTIFAICLAFGLELKSALILMMSAGEFLSPTNEIDAVYISYISSSEYKKEDSIIKRIERCEEYIEQALGYRFKPKFYFMGYNKKDYKDK